MDTPTDQPDCPDPNISETLVSDWTFEDNARIRAADIAMLQRLIPSQELGTLGELLPLVERNARGLASVQEASVIFWEALQKMRDDILKKVEDNNNKLTSEFALMVELSKTKDVPLHQLQGCISEQEKNNIMEVEQLCVSSHGSSLAEVVPHSCRSRAEANQKGLDKMSNEAAVNVERSVVLSRDQGIAKIGKRSHSSFTLFSTQAQAAKECVEGVEVDTDIPRKAVLEVSRCIGSEWRQIAIESLNLKRYQLDEIEEDNKKFREKVFAMFEMWKEQNRGQASARILFEKLNQRKDVDRDAFLTLKKYIF